MYHFIINPKSRSGRGLKIWNEVKSILDEHNITYQYDFTHYKQHAVELAQKICNQEDGIKNIIVLGGDGTVNEVINGINDFSKVLLGYIPSGSSNDFARSLGISSDPKIALESILSPKHFDFVDIGTLTMLDDNSRITTRKFAVSSGIGWDAAVCYEALTSNIKKVLNKIGLGKLTYVIIAIKQIISLKPTKGVVVIDGVKTHTYHNILFIANMIHKYEGGGLRMNPKADYHDQKLSVCLVHDISKLKVMLMLPTIIWGKHTLVKGVETFDCSTIEITLDDPKHTHTDGESAGTNRHITLNCAHDQLRIIT